MRFRGSLARRIVIAFVAMTLAVSGTFAAGIVVVVHLVEARLVSQEMSAELERWRQSALAEESPSRSEYDTDFYTSHAVGPPIPNYLEQVGTGFSELFAGGRDLYVFQIHNNGERFIVTKNQRDFEQREQVLFSVVLAGFLLSVLAAWGLGWLLARRVMAPVVRLSQQVRNRDPLVPVGTPLHADYASDEVGELAKAFDSALDNLRHALNRERLFTSDVSHEIRTPLMVIASSCELLMASCTLDESGHTQLLRVQRASAELLELVQVFLELARDSRNAAMLAIGSPLLSIAEESMRRFDAEASAKGLSLQLVVDDSDEQLYHAVFVTTVLSNLLRNALHYTDLGTVRVIVRRDGFRVEDEGVGIARQERAQIFDAFFRGAQARGEGLGLGLSIVRRICQHQGWHISVPDTERGCCFDVNLSQAYTG